MPPLARERINLDLKTLDRCFLAGLYLRADRASLASFEEDVLIDMFEQVCDVVPRCQDRCRLPLGSFMCVWGIMGAGGPSSRPTRAAVTPCRTIGDYFGVHYSRVSRIVGAAEQAGRTAKDKT